ncbi:NAD(P)H-dependent glycerol-3-phosphate dehydrogenase [Rhodocaloribacter litoris]|uniref:NAD(P)H-dependent glycerol-3-phosphate dehydrogenase n=1 Tax=Rhodocaloribacter litoris TaxID=2558931 RepID=UPI001E3C7831|nr:NAD(P)H-dependent glycerol-3-phosphate dehydrogenase [Rhodocaloribacter litoris]
MAKKIAVIGAGSWGTALTISLASAGHQVSLWARRPAAAAFMDQERYNPTYLPQAHLPDSVHITSNLAAAATDQDLWVFATPSQSVREVAARLRPYARPDLIVVSVAKGIENGTLLTTTQVLAEVLENVPRARIGVLYGPSHAEEVVTGCPTAVVAAAPDLAVAEEIQDTFMTPRLRVYANTDVIGVEIAGSVKNVMAIAAGISDGVGYGDNAKAALITRGLAEIQRLGLALGAEAGTFVGLAGIGDLVVTCMSRHSRNRYLGEQIGRGKTLEAVEREMTMVAEGVRTTRSVRDLARRLEIEMPITEAVYAILFEGKKPQEAVNELMTRSAKQEDWLPDCLQERVRHAGAGRQ